MRHVLLWGILALLFSCGSPPNRELRTATIEEIPGNFSYRGEVVDVRSWDDKNGRNYFVLCRSEFPHEDTALSVALFAHHLVQEQDSVRQLRFVRSAERQCQLINRAAFSPDIRLTDLDKDGLYEVLFAYVGGCTSKEEPLPIKMVMLENGQIFIIRGTTRLASGEGGKKRVEFSFFFAPPEFVKYANHLWRSYTQPTDVSI